MERLGIADIAKRCYRELSGGQQQRALLARALCATEEMILLDEPTAGLDPHATEELYRLVAALNKQDGLTVIMVTHDLSALRYASHVLHVNAEQNFFGTIEEYHAASKEESGRD
jgi:zinc transport system ATP-binding protein